MKLGPKYKIARRLGAPIFEKTQTAKFKASIGEKDKRRGGPKSEFAKQLLEKQKVRFSYGISEKQFSRYVKDVIESKTHQPALKILLGLAGDLPNRFIDGQWMMQLPRRGISPFGGWTCIINGAGNRSIQK